MKLYFEHYYESGESSFRHALIERGQASNPVIAVSPSSAVERSPYYNEVFRHLDAHHLLYGIVRAQGHALGQLSLYRPKSAQAFSAAQRSELSSTMLYVVHGVSQRGCIITGTQAFLDSDDDVVFLIGHDTPQAVEGSIAVRIQQQEPTLLRFVEALGGLGLSPKQREVALGLAKGSSNREIATAMGVNTNTVAYHVKQLFQRLDTHDREQMIAKILVDGAQAP